MKLSKKGEYALRSLINLGIAAEVGRSLVQVTELADTEQLPIKFLEQIMSALKEAGLVISARGILDRYTLADVVEVTLRKLRRDNVPLPFSPEAEHAATPLRVPARHARKNARQAGVSRLDETEGVLHQLLGDYAI
ncbi:MAG: Rrf2 family transcriptional regulator [Opitutales bacterium]|nr:Rrf2 family transcriptional regulator [Opitutales bacterium]